MPLSIQKKIVGYQVTRPREDPAEDPGRLPEPTGTGNVVALQPLLERDDELEGSTYKVKTPLSDHALYITINDTLINRGRPDQYRRPFEIFINSKNMENFSWIVALTRVISAIFRKGGDVTFLVEELRSVFDPRGGYLKPGGKYMPSLVAEIGECLENHLVKIGMINGQTAAPPTPPRNNDENRREGRVTSPINRQQCPDCRNWSIVKRDNCDFCLDCGESKGRCAGS